MSTIIALATPQSIIMTFKRYAPFVTRGVTAKRQQRRTVFEGTNSR